MFNEDTPALDYDNSLNVVSGEDSSAMFPTIDDFPRNGAVGTAEGSELAAVTQLVVSNDESPSSETVSDITGTLPDSVDAVDAVDVTGILDTVVIERDEFGIPHIQADSITDGVFAQGFVEAQDRLWQMDYRRRLANGDLAAVLGEDAVNIDTAIRTWGINSLAEEAYNNLNGESKAVVDAYTNGVNAYLANATELPAEFAALGYQPEAWLPTDTMAIAQLQTYFIGTTDGGELTRFELLSQGLTPERIAELFPNDGEGDTTIVQTEDIEGREFAIAPDEEIEQATELETQIINDLVELFPTTEASNSWVVSGDRTTTGMPFLANDPHLSLDNPSAWYQTEIDTPELSVMGASLPGTPGIQNGRNERLAWGQTSTQADTEDFYLLEETEDGTGYFYQGEVRDYEIREETIEVRDGETITLEVRESVYGSVVSDIFGIDSPVANRAVGLEPVDGIVEAYLGISQADNWEEFTTALDSFTNPISNFVYADVEGNIGYIAPGLYPIRQPGHTGEYPVAGTGEFDWQGFIPGEDVPQLYNPESGYIVTANNRLIPENYPYQINGDFAVGYRAERITELIESQDKLSLEDMQEIQYDRFSLLYRDFKPLIEQIEPNSEITQQWQQRLLDWDGNVLPDSQEASVFEAWYVELTRIPGEETGMEFWNEPRYLQEAITPQQATTALTTALERLGAEVPAWGDIHVSTFEPLVPEIDTSEPLQVPLGGDRYTVNVSPFGGTDFNTSFGVSYRQIIDFSDLNNSVYINPPGQNGDPNSTNYSNQLELWQQGEYLPMSTNDYVVAERFLLEPLISFPDLTGEYATGTTTYYLTDAERAETFTENPDDNRELGVKVWYPTDATTGVPAPYVSEELGTAISAGLELPEEAPDLGRFLQSIPTNSFLNAPLAESDTDYPVLLFSHGLGAFPELYTAQAEALASEGYIVVSINHSYDSLVSILPDGRAIPQAPVFTDEDTTSEELFAIASETVSIRAEDARFVLNELENSDTENAVFAFFADNLDLERVGILGHSLGGATAAETVALDSRFLAGINQDGGLFGSNADAMAIQPFMFINADRADAPLEELEIFDLQEQFLNNLIGDGYDATIADTEHESFSDFPLVVTSLADAGFPVESLLELTGFSGEVAIAPERALAITNSYNTAFFDRYLQTQNSDLLIGDASFPEVESTFYPGIQTELGTTIAETATSFADFINDSEIDITEIQFIAERDIVDGQIDVATVATFIDDSIDNSSFNFDEIIDLLTEFSAEQNLDPEEIEASIEQIIADGVIALDEINDFLAIYEI